MEREGERWRGRGRGREREGQDCRCGGRFERELVLLQSPTQHNTQHDSTTSPPPPPTHKRHNHNKNKRALLAAMEYLEDHLSDWLGAELEGYGDEDYLVIDCPGEYCYSVGVLECCVGVCWCWCV